MFLIFGILLIVVPMISEAIVYSNMHTQSQIILPSKMTGQDGQKGATATMVSVLTGTIFGITGLGSIILKHGMSTSIFIRNNYPTMFKIKWSLGRIFWVSSILYFLLILFTSNTLIYRQQSFAYLYGITSQSFYLIPSCGAPGTYPVLSVYVTANFGLMLTPEGIILCAFLPLLIAANMALILVKKSHNISRHFRQKALCALGGSSGLLGACPSCAGSIMIFLSTVASGSPIILEVFRNQYVGAISLSIASASLLYSVAGSTCFMKELLNSKRIRTQGKQS